MKLTLAQLRKLKSDTAFDEELDLSNELNGFEDIISSSKCNVHTVIKERGEETYLCRFHIMIDLIIEDCVTLDEIPYKIDVEAEELFSTDINLDCFEIVGMTLDTKEAILTNILINKPMSYSKTTFQNNNDEEVEELDESINPAFASLKDLL